jgi:hypothetical protein
MKGWHSSNSEKQRPGYVQNFVAVVDVILGILPHYVIAI